MKSLVLFKACISQLILLHAVTGSSASRTSGYNCIYVLNYNLLKHDQTPISCCRLHRNPASWYLKALVGWGGRITYKEVWIKRDISMQQQRQGYPAQHELLYLGRRCFTCKDWVLCSVTVIVVICSTYYKYRTHSGFSIFQNKLWEKQHSIFRLRVIFPQLWSVTVAPRSFITSRMSLRPASANLLFYRLSPDSSWARRTKPSGYNKLMTSLTPKL